MKCREQKFGPDHLETAQAQFILARDKALSFDFASAVELGRKAVATYDRHPDANAQDRLSAKNNLALHLAECGMLAEATEVIGEAAEEAKHALPRNDELRDRIVNNVKLIRTSFTGG